MATADLFSAVPAPTIAFSVLPFLTSDDLLNIRSASTAFRLLLHASDESEEIWKRALVRDFSFEEHDDGGGGASTEPSLTHHLNTLRTSDRSGTFGRCGSATVVSIFGFTATEAMFRAQSAFESWRHWRRASVRYYDIPGSLPRERIIRETVLPEKRGKTRRARNIHGPYFLRAAALWSKIEQWCNGAGSGQAGNYIRDSFTDGLSFFDWKYRRSLQLRFHRSDLDNKKGLLAIRAIYAFYGGQDTRLHPFSGLFGGYYVNEHVVCTRLLSTSDSEKIDSGLRDFELLPFASSSNHFKIFCIRVTPGEVLLFMRGRNIFNAVKTVQSNSGSGFTPKGARWDSALLWFEEYTTRLTNGCMCVDPYVPGDPMTEGITLFPTVITKRSLQGKSIIPVASCKVTRGVKVAASAIYTPELTQEGGTYIYSIEITLLTPEDDGYVSSERRGFDCCQIKAAHFLIQCSDGAYGRFSRDDLTRTLLLLREGEYTILNGASSQVCQRGTFRYQTTIPGVFCGGFQCHLQFVPGSLSEPAGELFDVELSPFAPERKPRFQF